MQMGAEEFTWLHRMHILHTLPIMMFKLIMSQHVFHLSFDVEI